LDRLIAQLNIGHFHRQLAGETDAARRQMILRLLSEEEAKLAELLNPPSDRKVRSS